MLAFYKEKIIISIVVVFLDGIITYFVPSYFNNINLFYPMLTISLIPFLYNYNIQDYYKLCFIIGIIYDLLYSHIFLFHSLIFLLLSKIDIKIIKYFKSNLLLYTILIILNIIIYDLILFVLVYMSNYQIVDFNSLIYKIKNSLLLNIMSGFVYYFWFKKNILRHKM